MIVCLCRGLSERDLRRMVAAGAAQSTEEISAACGAGADCGACLSMLDRLVDETWGRLPCASAIPVGSCA